MARTFMVLFAVVFEAEAAYRQHWGQFQEYLLYAFLLVGCCFYIGGRIQQYFKCLIDLHSQFSGRRHNNTIRPILQSLQSSQPIQNNANISQSLAGPRFSLTNKAVLWILYSIFDTIVLDGSWLHVAVMLQQFTHIGLQSCLPETVGSYDLFVLGFHGQIDFIIRENRYYLWPWIIIIRITIAANLNMESTPSSVSVVIKIAAMLILTFIELILNSFVEASFSLSSQSIYYINFYFIPIQVVVTAGIFIMMLIMMWQTFPLRYGLVARLLRQFKWTFVIVLLFICLTAAERGLKLSYVATKFNRFSEQELFADRGYQVLYYIRFFLYPIFYAVLINFSLKIIDPIFYKPNKWLN